VARLREAAKTAERELRELATQVHEAGHVAESEIFRAHALMARDPDLVKAALGQIET
jgi:phosphoenolpyruvate-protein kinase (PTS system EI component)